MTTDCDLDLEVHLGEMESLHTKLILKEKTYFASFGSLKIRRDMFYSI